MFEDIELAKREIRTRTSKIMGGYITEQLFVEKYHERYPDRMYAKGWWGGIENSANKTLTFFVIKDTLTALDVEVINRLRGHGYLCNQIIMKDDKIYICTEDRTVLAEEYVRERGLAARHDPNRTRNVVEGDEHLEECIERYERNGTLREIANSIYIEDHFLNAYYLISNIDLIGENDAGCPLYIEIKFKNEFSHTREDGTKELVFGIDKLQYEQLFPAFASSGMMVVNAILYNDIKDQQNTSTTVIFDYLRAKNGAGYVWKYKVINPSVDYAQHHFKSGYTSWYGDEGRTVRCVPLREYRDFGTAVDSGRWGICHICNHGYRVIRQYEGREFLGCTEYESHKRAGE